MEKYLVSIIDFDDAVWQNRPSLQAIRNKSFIIHAENEDRARKIALEEFPKERMEQSHTPSYLPLPFVDGDYATFKHLGYSELTEEGIEII